MAHTLLFEEGATPSPHLCVDKLMPSRLKEALDEAFMHTQALRQILLIGSSDGNSVTREFSDASTQTEAPPAAMLREAHTEPLSIFITPYAEKHSGRGMLTITPCQASSPNPLRGGVVDAAVQQACLALLTPQSHTASKGDATRPRCFAGQSTPPVDSTPRIPATQICASRRRPYHVDEETAPFGTYQHAHQVQEAQQRSLPAPVAQSRDDATVGAPNSSTASPRREMLHNWANKSEPRSPLDATRPDSAAPSSRTNTATVRLRAAMKWMQLQLQISPSRISRPRRYSDSSVSPALKILAPEHDMVQEGAADTAAAVAPSPQSPLRQGKLFDHRVSEERERASKPCFGAPAASSATVLASTAVAPSRHPVHWEPDLQPVTWHGMNAPASAAVPQPPKQWSQPPQLGGFGTAVAVGWPVTAQSQSRGPVPVDPWVGVAKPTLGPLRDISGHASNTGWQQPQRQQQAREERQHAAAHPGQLPKPVAADAASHLAEQQPRASGLRFSLRW